MARRLFCELGPRAYQISLWKVCALRHLRNLRNKAKDKIARERSAEPLPCLVYAHKSLIRRRLGDVDMRLQENKAVNLGLAAPKLDGILIRPGETFSFWALVGHCTAKKGYLEGLTLSRGQTQAGVGGGMCQFTNLLHWMVLHTDLDIVEHHHHNGVDLFPDFHRQIPFGTGTSIFYNYLDYRVKNNTDKTYQIVVHTTEEYLCGEIRCSEALAVKVHIREEDSCFYWQGEDLIRHNAVFRRVVDKRTGNTISDDLLVENDARVAYDHTLVDPTRIREPLAAR